MLPGKPKIFHGRQTELEEITKLLNQDSARIVILGPGGIGKTSLAKAALHHPEVFPNYQHSYFVPCDSASTGIEVAAVIGAHLGLKPARDLTKAVLQYLSGQPASLLILDNLETAWDPIESRNGVEELLSQLTDIFHLALLVTMRGAERPAKVRWTRPFLMPLKPLSPEAARQTFEDIADEFHEPQVIDRLLNLTDNMPLAVALIAHLVDYEGSSNILARWETERTSMLSAGRGRVSDMDASIRISLSSPRLTSSPGALDLLSLLSMLPDGLSDQDLLQSQLPIKDVLAGKSVLLGSSLAYNDDRKRLKSLVPIREHMEKFHPPARSLVQALRKYFHLLLDLYTEYRGSHQADHVNQIQPNLGNVHRLLHQGLQADNPDLEDTIACTLSLNTFSIATGHGRIRLMDKIPDVLQPNNHELHVKFITTVFKSLLDQPIKNPETLAAHAIEHLQHVDDLVIHGG
ncbi:P-loop containing nucleoside triphosphate hydrolase protein [Mycena albidolilacea]|uniref:P-loop containing nucleoside triphosphate hydrolase protein n=1 Tax=Mycena albidolilacea TaxID=1033008 RepID=A0AAD6ZSS7_9AGAR|nr:P-loop containing nucleoside triphosphate hydrolase protein [Mycena albidolilacea]